MGAEEHDHNTHVTPPADDPQLLDESSDEEDIVMIDKSPEQQEEENIQAWKRFHYAWWAPYFIWSTFALALVNMVLTLDQWHSTQSQHLPFDMFPDIRVAGGWQEENLRLAGSIIGILGCLLSFVLNANADKFKFIFILLFISSTLNCVAFGQDLYHLNRAVEDPICRNAVPDKNSRRFVCEFARFRATVIFDIMAGVFGYLMSFFVLYQVLTGVVSRRTIFNESTNTWEKVQALPDEDPAVVFPKTYRKQRPLFNGASLFTAALNATLLVLSITQMTGDYQKAREQQVPRYNYDRSTPHDVYIIVGNEPHGVGHGLGRGGWPDVNSELRLSVNALALVVLSFMIQWRRDGRLMQWVVQWLLLSAGAIYAVSFCLDLEEFDVAREHGDEWAVAQGAHIVVHRYVATLIFTGFLALLLLFFAIHSLYLHASQMRHPVGRYEGRQYGWWCCGEWEAKKNAKMMH